MAMASSSIQPFVIIDDEEVIMIDADDSNDELEILEYRCQGPRQASSANTSSSRSSSRFESITVHRRTINAKTDEPATELPQRHPLESSSKASASVASVLEIVDARSIAFKMENRRPPQYPPKSPSLPPQKATASESVILGSFSRASALCSPSQHLTAETAGDETAECKKPETLDSESQVAIGGSMQSGTFIDLDELEDNDDLWSNEEDLQILRVEERKTSTCLRKSSKIAIPKRNLPITAPLVSLDHYLYKRMLLRPSKTVELIDGDFLMITHIIQNTLGGTSDISLRGYQLQRCRSMNGLLERKLNEVCFFYEVDLDDPRSTNEQSAIEVSLYDIIGLRAVRKTNQLFPLGRNLALQVFRSPEDAAKQGGLTARWKYTCTYVSAEERWNNNPKERILQSLSEDECSKDARASDKARRFDWRGETIPGGAYRPENEEREQLGGEKRRWSVISLASSAQEPEADCQIVSSPAAALEATRSSKGKGRAASFSLPANSRKRRAGTSDKGISDESFAEHSKKARLNIEDAVEIARQDLDDLCVVGDLSLWRDEYMLDSPEGFSTSHSWETPSASAERNEYPPSQQSPSSGVDFSTSDIVTPPPTGYLQNSSVLRQNHILRSPGQSLTYGDAFCGGGGATRGAAMAGLRVKWGFDQWHHACTTWQANFPQAKCYELSSFDFVDRVRGSECRKPVNVQVDILHLSPPCQYFSPAHTVDCPNDELNVASLFAVGDVIKVAKPRIVTLEQTFGIVAVRFRKYFNSLIQMFTALGFSLRWAVINLAQWGLPQRRHRLIIIAACPGEFLPEFPPPTHSALDAALLPFSTVNQTLSQIPFDHDEGANLFAPDKYLIPWDGDSILPRAMTTSGGQNYHPSGKRDFTLREYAALQGFPPNHVFSGCSVKKQIGNAVPPLVAKILFESIKMQLDDADGVAQGKETLVID